jgi:hypothetical protein
MKTQTTKEDQSPELAPEFTIGAPTGEMSPYEQIMRLRWAECGGHGNPPKLIVSEANHADFLAARIPEKLITVMRIL